MPEFKTPILLPADPTLDLEAATKQYVDDNAGGGGGGGGGGGALSYLGATTVSAASEIDIDLPAGYLGFTVRGRLVGSTAASIRARMGGGSIDTGSNYDAARQFGGDSAGHDAQDGADHIQLSDISTADEGNALVVEVLPGYDDASAKTQAQFWIDNFDGTTQHTHEIAAKHMTDTAVDLLRLYPTAGNITGTVHVWGYTDSSSLDEGSVSLLTVREEVNTEDDHFNASTLDAKWTTGYSGTHSADLTTMPGWLILNGGTAILQAVPASGDWLIECHMIMPTITAAGYAGGGLIISDGTSRASSDDIVLQFGSNNSLTQYRYVYERFSNGSFQATYFQDTGTEMEYSAGFLRLEKSGSNYIAHRSKTGHTWQQRHSTTIPFTPTHFGLIGSAGTRFDYFVRA